MYHKEHHHHVNAMYHKEHHHENAMYHKEHHHRENMSRTNTKMMSVALQFVRFQLE